MNLNALSARNLITCVSLHRIESVSLVCVHRSCVGVRVILLLGSCLAFNCLGGALLNLVVATFLRVVAKALQFLDVSPKINATSLWSLWSGYVTYRHMPFFLLEMRLTSPLSYRPKAYRRRRTHLLNTKFLRPCNQRATSSLVLQLL